MNNLLAIFLITLNVINAFELDVYRMVGIEQDQFWSGSKIQKVREKILILLYEKNKQKNNPFGNLSKILELILDLNNYLGVALDQLKSNQLLLEIFRFKQLSLIFFFKFLQIHYNFSQNYTAQKVINSKAYLYNQIFNIFYTEEKPLKYQLLLGSRNQRKNKNKKLQKPPKILFNKLIISPIHILEQLNFLQTISHNNQNEETIDLFCALTVASFQLLTTHWSELSLRKVALIKFSEINPNSISQLLTNKPNGVLIILDQLSQDNEAQIWDLITTNLGPKGATIPIYFTYESEQINNHYTEIQSETEQEYQLQVTSVDQKQVLTLEDSYNLLESISNFKQNNPSTLIVLGIDENLPSAEITIPIDRFGIQSSIFFKIAREFKYQQRLNRNIIFYISTSSTLNEYGLKQFYKKQEYQRILSTIDTIIIFDQIRQNEKLHIEVSSSLLNQVQNSLTECDVQIEDSETTNISNKEIDTIRIYTQKQLKLLTQQVSTVVQDNQQLIINLVSQLIDEKPYEQQHQDQLFDEALSQFLKTSNRHPANLQKDSKFINDFNSLLRQLFKHTTKMQYVVKDKKFFTSSQLKGQIIKFYSAFIDLYLILGVGAWLVVIYAIIKYVPIFRIEQNANKKRK